VDDCRYWATQYLFPVSHAALPAPWQQTQERVSGFPFFNPVTLMKIVEWCRGERTDER